MADDWHEGPRSRPPPSDLSREALDWIDFRVEHKTNNLDHKIGLLHEKMQRHLTKEQITDLILDSITGIFRYLGFPISRKFQSEPSDRDEEIRHRFKLLDDGAVERKTAIDALVNRQTSGEIRERRFWQAAGLIVAVLLGIFAAPFAHWLGLVK